ncbi:MAG TPA: alpha/beta hydrolase fold domain-containing protein, partial [Caulobacteraceae bacterium]|nr:alpha/beta hydrolase fold domain-containing protein [Caulobacteraceae bacterium]
TLAAMRWAAAHTAELSVDADAIAISGDSAGAYLAIAATARLNVETPGAVKAQVLIYPLLHIDDSVWRDSLFADSRIIGRAAVAYIRSQLGPADVAAPSLLDQDLPPAPPTLIAVGRVLDPVRPDALAYARKLEAAGLRPQVMEFTPLPHGFANMTHMSATARRAVAEIGLAAGKLVRDACA